MRTTSFRSALLAAAAVAAALPAWAQTTAAPPASPPAPAAANPAPANQGARGPGAGGGPGAIFVEVDANKDGRATWDETWRFVEQRFGRADADRDGSLTRQEAEALRPTRRRPEGGNASQPSPEQAARRARFGDMMFRGIDANRDGRLTLDEVRPQVEARFRGLDADGDNAVSRSELPQGRQGPRHGRGTQGQGTQGQGTQAPAAPR
ncbi:MAG TPA: hypothetical protein VEX11_03085 [Acetobacteraceae bacterium]|nr:hypothetical protein [Acetobacteraceae bacterium]